MSFFRFSSSSRETVSPPARRISPGPVGRMFTEGRSRATPVPSDLLSYDYALSLPKNNRGSSSGGVASRVFSIASLQLCKSQRGAKQEFLLVAVHDAAGFVGYILVLLGRWPKARPYEASPEPTEAGLASEASPVPTEAELASAARWDPVRRAVTPLVLAYFVVRMMLTGRVMCGHCERLGRQGPLYFMCPDKPSEEHCIGAVPFLHWDLGVLFRRDPGYEECHGVRKIAPYDVLATWQPPASEGAGSFNRLLAACEAVEQDSHSDADATKQRYVLARVIYHLTTGQTPFISDSEGPRSGEKNGEAHGPSDPLLSCILIEASRVREAFEERLARIGRSIDGARESEREAAKLDARVKMCEQLYHEKRTALVAMHGKFFWLANDLGITHEADAGTLQRYDAYSKDGEEVPVGHSHLLLYAQQNSEIQGTINDLRRRIAAIPEDLADGEQPRIVEH